MIAGLPLLELAKQASSAAELKGSAPAASQFKVGLDNGFADLLTNAASQAVGRLEAAETVSAQALVGKADMREVVDAVMSAEQTLQTAIAIRDKIVTAYLEISRMAI